MASSASPEVYFLKPTIHVPNSFLPVLIYRHVLPEPLSEATAIEYLEKNQWSHGGTFKHFPQHHFHTVTHECYAIFKGSTRYLFGKGPLDEDVKGIEVDLHAGDVIVDPAGVAHCNLESSPDLEYIGVYPKVSDMGSQQHAQTLFTPVKHGSKHVSIISHREEEAPHKPPLFSVLPDSTFQPQLAFSCLKPIQLHLTPTVSHVHICTLCHIKQFTH